MSTDISHHQTTQWRPYVKTMAPRLRFTLGDAWISQREAQFPFTVGLGVGTSCCRIEGRRTNTCSKLVDENNSSNKEYIIGTYRDECAGVWAP